MKADNNKNKLVESVDEIIGFHGKPQEIAEQIDNVIFDYINFLYVNNDGLSDYFGSNIFLLKSIRNLFKCLNNEQKFEL